MIPKKRVLAQAAVTQRISVPNMIVKRVRARHLSDSCEDMHVSMSDYCWYPKDTCGGSPRPSDPNGRDRKRVRNTKAEVPLRARWPRLNGILLSSRVRVPIGIRHSVFGTSLILMSVTITTTTTTT